MDLERRRLQQLQTEEHVVRALELAENARSGHLEDNLSVILESQLPGARIEWVELTLPNEENPDVYKAKLRIRVDGEQITLHGSGSAKHLAYASAFTDSQPVIV